MSVRYKCPDVEIPEDIMARRGGIYVPVGVAVRSARLTEHGSVLAHLLNLRRVFRLGIPPLVPKQARTEQVPNIEAENETGSQKLGHRLEYVKCRLLSVRVLRTRIHGDQGLCPMTHHREVVYRDEDLKTCSINKQRSTVKCEA